MKAIEILNHFINGYVIADNVCDIEIKRYCKVFGLKSVCNALGIKKLPSNIPDGRYLAYNKPWTRFDDSIIPADYTVEDIYGGELYLMRIE